MPPKIQPDRTIEQIALDRRVTLAGMRKATKPPGTAATWRAPLSVTRPPWAGGPVVTPIQAMPPDGTFDDVRARRILVDAKRAETGLGPVPNLPVHPAVEVADGVGGGMVRLFQPVGGAFGYFGVRDKAAVLELGGGSTLPGRVVLRSASFEDRMLLEASPEAGRIRLLDKNGKQIVYVGDDGEYADVWVGDAVARRGQVVCLGTDGGWAALVADDDPTVTLSDSSGGWARMTGGKDSSVTLTVKPQPDQPSETVVHLSTGPEMAVLYLGGASRAGRIVLSDDDGDVRITADAGTGDIRFKNADCAEEFDVDDATIEPGTVLVLDDEPGRLRRSDRAYDSRVAGVVSGAGGYRPGILLDRNGPSASRRPVALLGKVFCRVEAESSPVGMGSLLTTSGIAGHAMAATDRERSFGAVLGKALAPLAGGRGLIPVLIALQ